MSQQRDIHIRVNWPSIDPVLADGSRSRQICARVTSVDSTINGSTMDDSIVLQVRGRFAIMGQAIASGFASRHHGRHFHGMVARFELYQHVQDSDPCSRWVFANIAWLLIVNVSIYEEISYTWIWVYDCMGKCGARRGEGGCKGLIENASSSRKLGFQSVVENLSIMIILYVCILIEI